MGIVTDALAIFFGSWFGNRLQKKQSHRNHHILAISIMIVSLVGFLENVYHIEGESIVSENLLTVLFTFLLGSILGDRLCLAQRLSNLSHVSGNRMQGFWDGTLFFGIGGLQISGPILLATGGDNSQLFLKSIIDLPFAVAYGTAYGKSAAFAAVPVALMQLGIFWLAHVFSAFFTPQLIAQLCAIGYVILFFSGYNLMPGSKHKINNVNMLPGMVLLVLYHFTRRIGAQIL